MGARSPKGGMSADEKRALKNVKGPGSKPSRIKGVDLYIGSPDDKEYTPAKRPTFDKGVPKQGGGTRKGDQGVEYSWEYKGTPADIAKIATAAEKMTDKAGREDMNLYSPEDY